MTDKFDKDAALARVVAYAKETWCWDDESFLGEAFEKQYDPKVDTPEGFVDALAQDYDLEDPRSVNWGHNLGM